MSPKQIGLIAGRGRYPILFAEEARRQGVEKLVIAAFVDDTEPCIEELADDLCWVHLGQLNKLIRVFTDNDVNQVAMAGQVTPGKLFKGLRPDLRTVKMLACLKERNADTIFSALIAELEKDGLEILPATTFLDSQLAHEGVMGKVKPSKAQLADIQFGRTIGRQTSRLDIGQTVVVKNGTVLAVEAFEGTDRAILRGGELGRGDVTVVKLAKEGQDVRFDVPCIGMQTVETMKEAGVKTLAVEAGITLFIDKDDVLDALNKLKIVVYGFNDPESAKTWVGRS